MTNITKHLDEPFTLKISVEENLPALYAFKNITFTPNIFENSAKITLNLREASSGSPAFIDTFYQDVDEFSEDLNITILILLHNADGNIIIHTESGTHIERPFETS